MHIKLGDKDRYAKSDKTALALKAARLIKGLSRKEAAARIGWKPGSFEQIENGRCNFSDQRIQRILEAYGCSREEFQHILKDPKRFIAQVVNEGQKDHTVDRKPRRNHFKIVTKEVRVIRTLRKRKGISQYQAARLCGYVPGGFGHIEVGRINLTKERIEHILKCLDFTWKDFQQLMDAPMLRDELIEECTKALQKLEDSKLESTLNIIKALIK